MHTEPVEAHGVEASIAFSSSPLLCAPSSLRSMDGGVEALPDVTVTDGLDSEQAAGGGCTEKRDGRIRNNKRR
jgi:hypothetical protein